MTEVRTRTGKIFDKVEFVTNFNRSYSCGGVGGEDYTVHRGRNAKSKTDLARVLPHWSRQCH